MKFGINQAISQTTTQLSCIQLETLSSRLWNFWWIKTYTTFNFHMSNPLKNLTEHYRSIEGQKVINKIFERWVEQKWVKLFRFMCDGSILFHSYDQGTAHIWHAGMNLLERNVLHWILILLKCFFFYVLLTSHYWFREPFYWHGLSLTHWGRDKMAAISQTTFWIALSWMNMYENRMIFH